MQPSLPASQPSSALANSDSLGNKKRRWPDMSAYGIHFGVLPMPSGETRMIMVDKDGAWAQLGKTMGFSQSRWFGIYVKTSTKLDIPGFTTNFPAAKVALLTDAEIRSNISTLMLERQNLRISKMKPGQGRISWHPHKLVQTKDAESQDGDDTNAAITPEQALRQTLHLGLNYMGHDVYESGDGRRFAKSGDDVIAKEDGASSFDPVFLRVDKDGGLVRIAEGLLNEVSTGKRLHSNDFIRFIEAAKGLDAHEDKHLVEQFHAAIDSACVNKLSALEGAGRDVYDEALKMHEGRPSFWRAPGSAATPLPVSVLMQSIAASKIAHSHGAVVAPRIADLRSQGSSHSWSLPAVVINPREDIPEHDIFLAGVFGNVSAEKNIAGVRVTRADHAVLLQSIERRSKDGLSVLLMTTDKAGKMTPEFRRVMSTIGQQFIVCGIADIAPGMVGAGNEIASRLVVIGSKRDERLYTYAPPIDIPIIFDYDNLWNWGETLRAAEFGEAQSFGEDGREENQWQAPYISSSQVSEPETMSPRNLLGPVRKALSRIIDDSGMGIDEFVSSRLGWTMAELEDRLSSEQIDAVALGIRSIEDGSGLVEADATGIGKGRVAAALAVYGKKLGLPVMFMTEKSDLFEDFYRDVVDIGCIQDLGRPFIFNNDLTVRDQTTNEILVRSPSRELASSVLSCGEIPKGFDLMMATYSQFNRKYDDAMAPRLTQISRVLRDVVNGAYTDAFDIACKNSNLLGHPDYAAIGIDTLEAAINHENVDLLTAQTSGNKHKADAINSRIAFLNMSLPQVCEHFSASVKADMTTLKHQWLYSGAMKGGLLILDESHVAAGADSQTGVNIRRMVEDSAAAVYSSATYAKDCNNFQLYSKIFPSSINPAAIGDILKRGGEPIQEILSAMLAEDGRLVRREHDLSNLEFKLAIDDGRKERNENWANAYGQILAAMSFLSGEVEEVAQQMSAQMEKALLAAIGPDANSKNLPRSGVQYTGFGSKLYNLSRTFAMALNADQSADMAIEALKSGKKPVITVESTMESIMRELVSEMDFERVDESSASNSTNQPGANPTLAAADPLAALDKLSAELAGEGAKGPVLTAGVKRPKASPRYQIGKIVGFKNILHAYVDSMFFANEQVRVGNKVLKSKSISLLSPEMQPAINAIRSQIEAMPDIPLSPIDLVRDRITAAGYSIDEISGRTLKLFQNEDGTHGLERMPARNKQTLVKDFNGGKLDALILSLAGSTGISCHAGKKFADQSQRVLIEMQAAADIAKRLQFWGRVNRKNQTCNPIIQMVSSGLPSELRLIAMQNSKLRRMSANISGNSDNSALDTKAPDILNRVGNEVCYRWMESNPKISQILGFKVSDIEDSPGALGGTRFVDMLTGRIGFLEVDLARKVYSEITSEFNALIEQYENGGFNPLKAAEYNIRAKRIGSMLLQASSSSESVFNTAVYATELEYPVSLEPMNKAQAQADAAAGKMALEAKYGTKPHISVSKAIEDAVAMALPTMLSKSFPDVNQALLSDRPNAIKNMSTRMEWLAEFVRKVTPGSLISVSNEIFSGGSGAKLSVDNKMANRWRLEEIFITALKVPQDNLLSMAGYKIVGYSSHTRRKVEMSLSALYARPSMWVEVSPHDTPATKYDHIIDDYFESNSKKFSGSERRVILNGNLFKAAELSESQKQGTAIAYSDDNGVWHHAILMPKLFTMASATVLPIIVESAECLRDAFASTIPGKPLVEVSNDFRPSNQLVETGGYRIAGGQKKISISLYGSTDKVSWAHANAEIKACLVNGEFKGSRGARVAHVINGKEKEFTEAFMAAANRVGCPVLLHGVMREWYNQYTEKKNKVNDVGQKDIQSALSNSEDDELNSLLSSPSAVAK